MRASAAEVTVRTGRVAEGKIVLDQAVDALEGKRVRVIVEADPDADVSAQQLADAWEMWKQAGADGPISDDEVDGSIEG